jgi:hypothetical protein
MTGAHVEHIRAEVRNEREHSNFQVAQRSQIPQIVDGTLDSF